MLIRSGLGVSFGVVFSVLLFKRRAWPAFVGLGFGAGRAWEECDNVSFPQCNMCHESDSVLTTANSPSSERQHLRKTASVLSDHRRYFTCERGYETIPFCGFDALHAKYALYNRAWYRLGQFKAVHLDVHCFTNLSIHQPFLLDSLRRSRTRSVTSPSCRVILKLISLHSLKHGKPMRTKVNTLIQLSPRRPRLLMPWTQTSSIRIFPTMPETCSQKSAQLLSFTYTNIHKRGINHTYK